MNDALTILDLPPAPPHLANDPVLRKAKDGLRKIYGARLAGVVLYGSRARGEARPDSDYDLLALIEGYDPSKGWDPALHELMLELFQMEPHEIEVNILPRSANALEQRTIFMHNVREEGFRL
ncbi:MAG: nucleotidyltransferase domain-containing protein [Alphaproteobacteria bacterium]|nr:nucleotidyltransferase domain-containing protein [Alphaproteobacteria bacterium]MBV9694207.1 nucleotidyltransferase domain-containing protein [Alphaproteobacteria bacterium]